MHPVFARFLDAHALRATLERARTGKSDPASLDPAERHLLAAAHAHPQEAALITSGEDARSPEAQQAVLMLAATAAALALGEDPRLGGRVVIARTTLTQQGASEGEVMQFLASLILEEAFGEEDQEDAIDRFDLAFVEDSLGEIPALARLTRDQVEQLVKSFQRGAPEGLEPAYTLAGRALVEAAWFEGPQSVNHEHLEEALAHVQEELGADEEAQALPALRAFIEVLHQAGLIGSSRKVRLEQVLQRAQGVRPTPS